MLYSLFNPFGSLLSKMVVARYPFFTKEWSESIMKLAANLDRQDEEAGKLQIEMNIYFVLIALVYVTSLMISGTLWLILSAVLAGYLAANILIVVGVVTAFTLAIYVGLTGVFVEVLEKKKNEWLEKHSVASEEKTDPS